MAHEQAVGQERNIEMHPSIVVSQLRGNGCRFWFGLVFFSFVSFLSGLYSSSGIYSRSIFKIKSLFNYIYSLFGYLRLLSNAHDFNDSNRHRPSRILYCMMYGVVQKEPPSTVYDGSSFPWNYLVVCE